MESDQHMIHAIYTAFNSRDIDAVLVHMHPNVDWPASTEGGRVLGHADVRAYWTRQWKTINPKVEPISITEELSGQTIVDVHQVVHDLTGHLLVDQIVHHVYTIRNGIIEKMDIR